MHEEEYVFKLQDALNAAIFDFVRVKEYLDVKGYTMQIEEVNRVESSVSIENVKLHQLLSGKEVKLIVEGSVFLMEKQENGSRGREVKYWVRPATVKFSMANENFAVVDISGFLPLEF